MDKTRFWISCEKAQLVDTIDPNKPFCIIDPNNHDYITSIECISSVGETILPILLVSKINNLYKWYHHNDLEGDIVIGTTEIGYANNNTALE